MPSCTGYRVHAHASQYWFLLYLVNSTAVHGAVELELEFERLAAANDLVFMPLAMLGVESQLAQHGGRVCQGCIRGIAMPLDRGLSIPGAPIGCDFEIIHEDYSNGKFSKLYGDSV